MIDFEGSIGVTYWPGRTVDIRLEKNKPAILKSTVPPEALYDWQIKCPFLHIVFNPEFLTERTARLDFQQASRHIFGVNQIECIAEIALIFNQRFPEVSQYWTSYEEASLIKYFTKEEHGPTRGAI